METKFPRRILDNMDELKRLDRRGGAVSSRGGSVLDICFYFVNSHGPPRYGAPSDDCRLRLPYYHSSE